MPGCQSVTNMTPAIEFANVTKRYGAVEALRGVSFSVAPGEMFGLIGPDGAGKGVAGSISCTGEWMNASLHVEYDYKRVHRHSLKHLPSKTETEGLLLKLLELVEHVNDGISLRW